MKKLFPKLMPAFALVLLFALSSVKLINPGIKSVNAVTTFFISSSSGSDLNSGADSLHPWKTFKTWAAGNFYRCKYGDTFYTSLPQINNTSPTLRLKVGAWGDRTKTKPVFSQYCKIKPNAWQNIGTNLWEVHLSSANVTGFVPATSNAGFIKVNGVIHGLRAGVQAGLNLQWEFYCDFSGLNVFLYSTTNPNNATIEFSNDERAMELTNYMTVENIQLLGTATSWLIEQPVQDTIQYVDMREYGGEMKSATDTLRQGAGFAIYNGGTDLLIQYCSAHMGYEEAYTFQTHASGAVGIAYNNCNILHCTADSCEGGFNPSVAVTNAHGFVNCHVKFCRFDHMGYSWSHPPGGKPVDNQATGLVNNFALELANERDITIENDTFYAPREGLCFISGSTAAIISYTSKNNEIYLADTTVFIRKNCPTCATKWTWKLNDSAKFVLASGQEVGSHWHSIASSSRLWYRDADGDTYGNPNITISSVTQPVGYVSRNTDCNDANAAVHPGATEVCDGVDNNCNGQIDEGVIQTFYRDADADGYGDATKPVTACSAPSGYVSNNTDCNDGSSAVHPGAVEICDGLDNNCNGSIDEGVTQTYYRDADVDGYGDATKSVKACSMPSGYVANSLDCNDADSSISPGHAEVCDGKDNNCNGLVDEGLSATYYRDADGDTYGNPSIFTIACSAPSGYVTNGTDCDDGDSTINPGHVEVCGDGKDNNCDGVVDEGSHTYYQDWDGDTYGDPTSVISDCSATPPSGYVSIAGDCNDNDAGINPGATEICDGIDNNCDGVVDEGFTLHTYYYDGDGDGYGKASVFVTTCSSTPPSGYVVNNTDCNDGSSSIYPGATEVCGNGIDDNCNGVVDEGCVIVPNVAISISDDTVYENQTAVVNVTLSAVSTQVVRVNYVTAQGTATLGDYQTISGTLTFQPGVKSQSIAVSMVKDKITEPTEYFYINLSNPTGGSGILDGQSKVTILDGSENPHGHVH